MKSRPTPWRLAPLLLLLALPTRVMAFDAQLFKPAMDSRGLITLESSLTPGNLKPSFGLYLNYSLNALRLDVNGEPTNIINHFVTGDVQAALGILSFLEVGLAFPVSILRGTDLSDIKLSAEGVGDLRLQLKATILDERRYGVGLAVLPFLYFGTGSQDNFMGETWTVVPHIKVVTDIEHNGLRATVNLGAKFRGEATYGPVVLGHELTYGLGLGYQVLPERLELVAETFGYLRLSDPGNMESKSLSMEALGALKIFLLKDSFLSIGAGGAFVKGYGSPDFRAFAGIIFEPSVGDKDGDGIPDDKDKCPDKKEDFDGFEDEDGCPDLDNDRDGIPDEFDDCPNVPEDKNGIEDDDGCPEGDKDRDGDGIPDALDKCPDEAEDRDGWQDEDGCPDPDNDRDGIPDLEDRCPNQGEDFDGYQDEDGCPEPDNDQDGLLDEDDACPNDAGDVGNQGCPDKGKPSIVVSKKRIFIFEKINFETGKAAIKADSFPILNALVGTLSANPHIHKVRIEGHTDSRGSATYNQRLSDQRAASVRRYLIDHGISADRLRSVGYGEDRPIDSNETEAGRFKNRRVEFHIEEAETGGNNATPAPGFVP